MGSVKKDLYKIQLPEREAHHCRLFAEVAENIHIHHREFRTVFSVDEYLEYADIIKRSTEDIRTFLAQNPDYKEHGYPTGIMIAGGDMRQYQGLENSPKPNEAKYLNYEFAIELQDEFVTDEVQIHYRDFRFAVDRKHFRIMAEGFKKALDELDEFEKTNEYVRESHPDRVIDNFNSNKSVVPETQIMGTVKIPIDQIQSPYHTDISNDWRPDKESIQILKQEYQAEGRLFPILVSTESDGTHLILDGHHRVFAAKELGLPEIDAIVSDLTHEGSAKIRAADVLLKEFDKETSYRYGWSHFMKTYVAFTLNRYYADSYRGLMKRQRLYYRIGRKVKRWIFGKRYIFKTFNEARNNR